MPRNGRPTQWQGHIATSSRYPTPLDMTHLQVAEMLDSAFYDQSKFLEGGWVDGLKYEDEILDLLQVTHPVFI